MPSRPRSDASVDIEIENVSSLDSSADDAPNATVVFLQDQNIVRAEKRHVYRCAQTSRVFLYSERWIFDRLGRNAC